MSNVILKFQRKVLQRTTLLLSADFVVDNKDTFRVAPDTSTEAEIEIGEHQLRVSIPIQGNESFVITTQINIKPNMRYEVTYSVASLSPTGIISVSEIPVGGLPGAGNIVTTVKKGPKNHLALSLIIIMIVISAYMTYMYYKTRS